MSSSACEGSATWLGCAWTATTAAALKAKTERATCRGCTDAPYGWLFLNVFKSDQYLSEPKT
jgi:hypothetical protein